MYKDLLKTQKLAAEQALLEAIGEIESVENEFLLKKGKTTKGKRGAAMVLMFAGLILTGTAVFLLWNHNFGTIKEYAPALLLTAGGLLAVFLLINILKIRTSEAYYREIFESLHKLKELKGRMERYKNNLEQRFMEMLGSEKAGWDQPIEQGVEYQPVLETLENRISKMEEKQSKGIDRFMKILYYPACYAVAAVEVFALQDMVLSLVEYENWAVTVFYIAAAIAVFAAPTLLTYYLHKCRGIEISWYSFFWILLGGVFGILVCGAVAAVIALVLIVLYIILQIILFAVAIIIGIGVLAGVLFGNNNSDND